MRKILWLLLLLVGLGGSASAQSYEKIQLYCEKGGETVTTDGRTSTTRVQRSYPSCTVTVYDGGTLTLASIASDSIGTPKANPFTADSDGYISFYATDGTYDVKMSGSGLAAPITRSGFWVITSGGGGGGISGSGTTNRFPIFTSSTAIGNSVFQQVGTSEFAPAATGKRINLGTGSQQVVEIANAAVTGTTQNRIAKLTGAPSTAVIATTTDTTKLVGVVIAGAGTSGNAQIVTNGNVSCEFDGATTAGNYVGASTTTNGKCKDLGATLPVSGVQVIGRVLQTIGSAGNADVFIFTGEQGRGGVSGSGTTAYLSYWTSSNAIGATNSYYDTLNNLYTFGGNVDVANLGNSQFTIETDQVIFNGGVSRANNAIMQTMKATATQTGDFQRFTTSVGAARFRVDIDGDVLPRGVNYTWPASLPASTGCLQITSAGVMSVVSCVSGTGVRYALNIKQSPYSCVGDGVTDDTTCFQDAIDDAALAGGYMVYAPAGTYKVTGLTVPGGVTLQGDGRAKSIIYSNTNAVIVDAVVGSGSYAFKGPELYDLQILGSGNVAHTSQIGLQIEDATYFLGVVVQDIEVSQTGSHGVYFGKVFSSYFDNITSGSTMTGYPFLFNQINMPGNTFRNLYAADVNSTSPAGYRIRSGNITCWGCNGINNSSSNSWWAIVGDKIGTDGASSNRSAYFTCNDCNIESSRAGGILHYYNSTSYLDGRTEFTGDGGSSGTYIALKYEIDTTGGLIPSDFPKGNLGPLVVFTNSPLSYYANSEVIHSNDLPPVTVAGQVRQADGSIITSYRNTTNSRSEKIYRLDAAKPVTTITASANYTEPGATNYEGNCASPCTLTLPWPGFWNSNEQLIYVRNIGAGALTLAANSSGTFNGGAGPVLAQNESVLYLPHTASADYRQVGFAGSGATNRVAYYSSLQNLTSSSNLTYDGTTFLNQRAGGNPYFAANDTTNSISTRFGPLAGAPDRAIVGTVTNHPFGFWTNGTEKWTVGTAGHFTPGAASTYNIGSTSLPINDIHVNGEVQWSTSGTVFDTYGTGSPEGVVTAAVGSVYRRTNGASGTTLYIKESGSGNTGWVAVTSGSPSLTATYVGYGNGSNVLTGTSDFAYNTTTKTLTITSAASGVIDLATTSTNSAFKLNGATHPGTAGGLILPFVGGGNGDAPGLWWTSSASYATTSGLFLSNGFNFQGANGTHDNLKINQGTASSSSGTTRYTFAPSSSLFTQNLSTAATGSTHDAMQTDLTSSGGAGGANLGIGQLYRIENSGSSLTEAARISVNWTTATAASETSRIVFATTQSGLGLGDSFTIEGDQHYGVLWDKGNISGSVTLDFINGNTVTATLTGNVTSLAFSNLRTGGVYYIHFIQNALGPWTLTVPAALKVEGGYTITASVNARDLLICSATSTTQLYCAKAQNQQ